MNFGNYKLNNPESFETPEYVIFEDIINHNLSLSYNERIHYQPHNLEIHRGIDQ